MAFQRPGPQASPCTTRLHHKALGGFPPCLGLPPRLDETLGRAGRHGCGPQTHSFVHSRQKIAPIHSVPFYLSSQQARCHACCAKQSSLTASLLQPIVQLDVIGVACNSCWGCECCITLTNADCPSSASDPKQAVDIIWGRGRGREKGPAPMSIVLTSLPEAPQGCMH